MDAIVTMFRARHENRVEQAAEHEHRNGHLLPQIESEFHELVRPRGIPKVGAESGNGGVKDVNSLTQSISGPVVLEIDKLIVQLQDVRDHLVNEGQRVQRAISEYAQMSQAASKSTKIIAENLAKWAAENSRPDRVSAAVPQTQSERSQPPVADGPPPS
jgi:PleD family two-component response regulator